MVDQKVKRVNTIFIIKTILLLFFKRVLLQNQKQIKGKKMTTKANKKPMPIALTEQQKKWLKSESDKTGETMAAVVRKLIQTQMESDHG